MHFNKIWNNDEGGVKIEDYEVSKSDHFRYLGWIIHKEWETKKDVIYRI